MNVATFNEPFEALFKASGLPARRQRDLLSAPLFLHEDGADAWEAGPENAYARDDIGFPILPFPAVRLALTSVDATGRTKTMAHLIAERVNAPGTKEHGALTICGSVTKQIRDGSVMFEGLHKQELAFFVRLPEMLNAEEHKVLAMIFDCAKKKISTPEPSMKTGMRARGDLFYELVSKFSIDVMSPANHIAAVRPSTAGKSVEWQRARTHYVILNRRHPANTFGLKTGSTVNSDDQHRLERIAHSRRAHYRLLRSPRFKNKAGQRIFIRSTWVGPKEWRDESGSIYLLHSR